MLRDGHIAKQRPKHASRSAVLRRINLSDKFGPRSSDPRPPGELLMDHLWTPWRYGYVSDAAKDDACIFCKLLAAGDDRDSLIVLRGEKTFVILNRFPYTTGHVMIVPYEHIGDFSAIDAETSSEMMQLAQRVQRALAAAYKPDGYNLGMNLGRCAGAGITGHVHLHVLPRWNGDTNFMATVGETRVHPEELTQTYHKLRIALTGKENV